ncbi:MAG: hypothetical protein ACK5MI_04310 [Mangrovibacterium sp.]
MRKSFFIIAALFGLSAGTAMAHEEGVETGEKETPWSIEVSSTIPVASGLEQTSTLHFGREIGDHVDIGIFGAWIGKDWSEKKGQFYGTDIKYFFHPFSDERKTNYYISLGIAYNTELEEEEHLNSIRYGWKFGIDHEICKHVAIFAETGQDLLYTPKTESYKDDLSGLLLVGLKFDF